MRFLFILLAAAPALALAAGARPDLPETPRRPVSDGYHGVTVVDDYRWMEQLDAPDVKRWAEAQGAYSRATLDALPAAPAVRARVSELMSAPVVSYSDVARAGKLLFALKKQPPKDQPSLVAMSSPEEPKTERTVVDPTVVDPSGHTAIDFFVPSLDGKRVAVALSKDGSENADVHVFDVDGGKELGDLVTRVNYPTGGGSLAWNADGSGFYYTRYPRPGERPPADEHFYQQVWLHQLGTPEAKDRYMAGKEFPRIAETNLESSADGRHVLARVSNGDGGEHAFWLGDATGAWKKVARDEDGVKQMHFGLDGALYAVSVHGAPRGQVLRMPLDAPTLASAKVVVPAGEGAIQDVTPAASRLYVRVMVGGPQELHVYDLEGKRLAAVPLPPVAAVNEVELWGGDEVLAEVETFLEPARWIRVAGGKVTPTALTPRSPVDLSGFEVRRDVATSKDGTKVPISILQRKGLKLDGQNPTILYAYGGYGISQSPNFKASRAVWLEQGGVFAVANIRGGGEWGEEWHLAGNLTKKQNDYDDFAASAQRLIDLKITNPKKLAIQGGSNGGLLMGAQLTQHPELYAAVATFVGIYDMLRVELTPNGAFNVTEYGTVKDPAQFKALYGYSPYHHVVDGKVYPPTIVFTGMHDGRVEPWHSFKMTARLQAASPKNVVLLRVNARGGHGPGAALSDLIEQTADMYTFLFHHLGVTYKQVARG